MPTVEPGYKVGDRALFSPGPEHFAASTAQGDPAFSWLYTGEKGGSKRSPGHGKGDKVNLETAGKFKRRPDGQLVTGQGHPVELGPPLFYWPAWIVAILPDGSVALDVIHPISLRSPDHAGSATLEKAFVIHHVPDLTRSPGAKGVPYDPKGKGPHSFHLAGD